MATQSTIEWTETTWNPIRGCTRVSPGCERCYAESMAHRFSGPGGPYEGLTRNRGNGARWTGQLRLVEKAVDEPMRWRRPRLVFVNSMSDLFHEKAPLAFIQQVFATMQACPQHTFQILTKRADRLVDLAGSLPWPPNVWMGVSVESTDFRWRIDLLRRVPAQVRFLSLEPLLGPLPDLDLDGIHWVIVGGESGAGARAVDREWIVDIRRQCRTARVPFFFKQWGGIRKKIAGRELDGRTYNEMPVPPRVRA
ncbi:MAG: DUF5131 family protein [Sandaracinaceae bacterium]